MGGVDLSFANTEVDSLNAALAADSLGKGIHTLQTGRSAAFRVFITPLHDFADFQKAIPIIQESFLAVMKLLTFYQENKSLLQTPGLTKWT